MQKNQAQQNQTSDEKSIAPENKITTYQISFTSFPPNTVDVSLIKINYPFRGRWLPFLVSEQQKKTYFFVDIENPKNTIELNTGNLCPIERFHVVSVNKFFILSESAWAEYVVTFKDGIPGLNIQFSSKSYSRKMLAVSPNGHFLLTEHNYSFRTISIFNTLHLASKQIFNHFVNEKYYSFIGISNTHFYYRKADHLYLHLNTAALPLNPFYTNHPCLTLPPKNFEKLTISPNGQFLLQQTHYPTSSTLFSINLTQKIPTLTSVKQFNQPHFLDWLSDNRLLMKDNEHGLQIVDTLTDTVEMLTTLPKDPNYVFIYDDKENAQHIVTCISKFWGKFDIYRQPVQYKLLNVLNKECSALFPPEINRIITSYLSSFFSDQKNSFDYAREDALAELDNTIAHYTDLIKTETEQADEDKRSSTITKLFSKDKQSCENKENLAIYSKALTALKDLYGEIKVADNSISFSNLTIQVLKEYAPINLDERAQQAIKKIKDLDQQKKYLESDLKLESMPCKNVTEAFPDENTASHQLNQLREIRGILEPAFSPSRTYYGRGLYILPL